MPQLRAVYRVRNTRIQVTDPVAVIDHTQGDTQEDQQRLTQLDDYRIHQLNCIPVQIVARGGNYSTENFSRTSQVCFPRLSRTVRTTVYAPSFWSFARFKLSTPG